MSETEKKVKKVKKVKKQETNEVKEETNKEKEVKHLYEFPEEGPNLVSSLPDFLSILLSFFIEGHKYVALQELEEGVIVPAFFLLKKRNKEGGEMEGEFVKHKNTVDEQGRIHVEPLWEEKWLDKKIENNVVWNCMPFDENRDYYYITEKNA